MPGKTFRSGYIAVAVQLLAVLFIMRTAVTTAADAGTMTYGQALERVPDRQIPKFWMGDVTGLPTRFEQLTEGAVSVIQLSLYEAMLQHAIEAKHLSTRGD